MKALERVQRYCHGGTEHRVMLNKSLGQIISYMLFVALIITSQTVTFAQTLDGFSVNGSQEQRRIEEQFRAVPAPTSAREHLRRLTIEPHVAGTKEDYATAIYVRDQMRSYGLPAELKEYQVWLNYPKTDPIVELMSPRAQLPKD